jgi:membrane-anchored mycosin MYCP
LTSTRYDDFRPGFVQSDLNYRRPIFVVAAGIVGYHALGGLVVVRAIRRRRYRPRTGTVAVLLALLSGLTVLAGAGPASAASRVAAGPTYVKYVVVVAASYQGAPENLSEIAGRFLGDSSRASEIFHLNAGVAQADGGKLTDPAALHAGWVLTLPWDAVGPEVRYGLPPSPAPAVPPAAKPSGSPKPAGRTTPSASATGGCAGSQKNTTGNASQWAMLRVAPDNAWAYSRGGGVIVAIVDSGVDAALPELAGRVTAGADIIAGTGRGDIDCLGTGTAMAGIVAARGEASGGVIGMAPDATVMPVRIGGPKVAEADQASAIKVAVATGAKVVALGEYVDLTKAAVVSAIELATDHDVVVVAGAPRANGSDRTSGLVPAGLLRVGAINIDGAPATSYEPSAVDVVAPGVDVTSLGISGTGRIQRSGTPYAAAFAAGEAALVRSMYPHLTVAQVVRRIEATADRMGSATPDATFGWGLIDPGVAVTRVIADEGRGPAAAPPPPATGWSSLRTRALIVVILLALVMVLLLVLRIRRMVRLAPMPAAAPASDPAVSPDSGLPAAPGQVADPGPGELVTAGAPAVLGSSAIAGVAGVEGAVGASARGADGRRGAAPRPAAASSTMDTEVAAGSGDERAGPADRWWRHGPNGA